MVGFDNDPRTRFERFLRTRKTEDLMPKQAPEVWDAIAARNRETADWWSQHNVSKQMDRARELSEIGLLFAHRTFETFHLSDPLLPESNLAAYRAALDCAASNGDTGLGIYGAIGKGKSHLAGGIVNNSIARGIPAIFTTTVVLLDRLRVAANKRGDAEAEARLIAHYASIPVLVLDDLGKEKLSEWGAPTFFALINARYENKRKLITTSNYDWKTLVANKYLRLHEQRGCEGIDATLGPAIMDRILEMTGPWIANKAPGERGKR